MLIPIISRTKIYEQFQQKLNRMDRLPVMGEFYAAQKHAEQQATAEKEATSLRKAEVYRESLKTL
ncbi:MAG: hypothetical protein IBX50_08525 [Marinospirillum sp.]|uniref:hypothetical protein n=1 Tax=Marinospirillum sp. TaxID=2183934 RepID=UPI0019E29054|nr:hypothetical protein [Marinospirillum sp.]MBE0506751.1 hypothetical protein [Marinospirillum sp.]